MCVPDVVKNVRVKVLDLMSRTNEIRDIKWHETCKCKCRLDVSVCNNRCKCWNDDKCRCGWKELIDKDVCDEGFIWNSNNCNMNVINHVMLENIQIIKVVSAGKISW